MGRKSFTEEINAEARERVIMVVREMIAARRKVTMRGIGTALNISAMTAYRVFPLGKAEMLHAAAPERFPDPSAPGYDPDPND